MTLHVDTEDPTSPAARALIAALSAELGALYGDDGAGRFAPEDVMGERAAFVVARRDKAPVGCGALRPMADPTVAEIKRMYVQPQHRGQGIAARILIALETLARQYTYRAARLETGVRQPGAIRLYEKAGYTPIPCFPPYDTDPLSRCFEKRL